MDWTLRLLLLSLLKTKAELLAEYKYHICAI
jgi:hypothetical protein